MRAPRPRAGRRGDAAAPSCGAGGRAAEVVVRLAGRQEMPGDDQDGVCPTAMPARWGSTPGPDPCVLGGQVGVLVPIGLDPFRWMIGTHARPRGELFGVPNRSMSTPISAMSSWAVRRSTLGIVHNRVIWFSKGRSPGRSRWSRSRTHLRGSRAWPGSGWRAGAPCPENRPSSASWSWDLGPAARRGCQRSSCSPGWRPWVDEGLSVSAARRN
jgi:hypothetical protein